LKPFGAQSILFLSAFPQCLEEPIERQRNLDGNRATERETLAETMRLNERKTKQPKAAILYSKQTSLTSISFADRD
jgi:hypothetical protein